MFNLDLHACGLTYLLDLLKHVDAILSVETILCNAVTIIRDTGPLPDIFTHHTYVFVCAYLDE